MGDVRDIKDAAWAAYCKAPTCRDMGRSKVDAAVDSVLAISARAEVPEGVSRLVDALEGAMIESLHGEGFDLWAKNRGKFRNRLPENVGAIVVKMRALLAAAPQPAGEPRSDLVPGVMRCAKCAFQLHRVTLYVRSGTTGAGDSDTEPCPNGCGPLWPVTWRQWAEEAQEYAQRLQGELNALKAEPAASAPVSSEREAMSRMKHGATRLHAIVYTLAGKHPDIPELQNDGLLHKAVHDILAVDTPGYLPGAHLKTASDDEVNAWATRHGIGGLTAEGQRAAFADAQSWIVPAPGCSVPADVEALGKAIFEAHREQYVGTSLWPMRRWDEVEQSTRDHWTKVARRLSGAQQCCMCGKRFDAREREEGGGPEGAQLADGRRTCSPDCWEHACAQQAEPATWNPPAIPAGTDEAAMVVIERDPSGKPTVWCDPEIVDIVGALNTRSLRTVASCSGHDGPFGFVSLVDGRELLILPDYESARFAERALGDAFKARQQAAKDGVE